MSSPDWRQTAAAPGSVEARRSLRLLGCSLVQPDDLAQDLLGVQCGYFALVVKSNAELIQAGHRGVNPPLEKVRQLFVEDFRSGRVAHVVASGVMLGTIDVGGGNSRLLDPEPVDVVLEPQPGREERRQPKRVVVACYTAVHPPILLRYRRAEVHQYV